MLDFEPEVVTPQSEKLAGRFNSVADYHEAYKSGEITPLQVVETLLPLIRRDVEKPSKYANAWIQTHVDEVLAAAKASTERWAAGKPLGVLDGVPFGVKDDTAVKGYVSTMGMKVNKNIPYFNKPAEKTIWPAQKMEEAGAIMVGKMNQHEIGMDTTGCNVSTLPILIYRESEQLTAMQPVTGTPTNWYNTSYFPGGSSSGGGSALSGGVVPITIGTDAGGSMRIPPAFCGVYGLKTTHNRTATRNSSVAVIGPMASTVSDLVIGYRVMSQPNPEDPDQHSLALSVPPAPDAKKYLGICREWLDQADPDVRSVYDAALKYLTEQAGYEAVDIKLAYLREGQLAHAATCLTEATNGCKTRVADWDRTRYLEPLNHHNALLISVASHTPAEDYLRWGQIRGVIMRHLAFLFEKYPGLLVLTPTTPVAGWPIHPGDEAYGTVDGNLSIRNMTYAWYANMSGCPAVTCPAGYVEPQQGEGTLPVGLMAMGEWGAEEQLLSFARDTEKYLNEVVPGGRRRPEQWLDVLGEARKGAGAALK